jgi:hypothetical protein
LLLTVCVDSLTGLGIAAVVATRSPRFWHHLIAADVGSRVTWEADSAILHCAVRYDGARQVARAAKGSGL